MAFGRIHHAQLHWCLHVLAGTSPHVRAANMLASLMLVNSNLDALAQAIPPAPLEATLCAYVAYVASW